MRWIVSFFCLLVVFTGLSLALLYRPLLTSETARSSDDAQSILKKTDMLEITRPSKFDDEPFHQFHRETRQSFAAALGFGLGRGGVHILMGDGAVKFVTDSIEVDNVDGEEKSPYGLWGALGTRATQNELPNPSKSSKPIDVTKPPTQIETTKSKTTTDVPASLGSHMPMHFIGFRHLTPKPTNDSSFQWDLDEIQLVSIENAQVYVLEERVSNTPLQVETTLTRDYDAFENQAIQRMEDGDDVVVENHDGKVRMLGALRCEKACARCHKEPNRLLGAFTYRFTAR
ncbi:hypothetical protein CA13_23890 [Planctomycetes bacterium CA13]|uniref:DUF1559 domain-containing protein n=1 Tax=Novipirellula herctigrandis TaxID=2527986 RepID=A0A5C5Z0P0_9BACT|nr:hypothetical protein CA13_23890 [Planctomycetes bacterium CA13]